MVHTKAAFPTSQCLYIDARIEGLSHPSTKKTHRNTYHDVGEMIGWRDRGSTRQKRSAEAASSQGGKGVFHVFHVFHVFQVFRIGFPMSFDGKPLILQGRYSKNDLPEASCGPSDQIAKRWLYQSNLLILVIVWQHAALPTRSVFRIPPLPNQWFWLRNPPRISSKDMKNMKNTWLLVPLAPSNTSTSAPLTLLAQLRQVVWTPFKGIHTTCTRAL